MALTAYGADMLIQWLFRNDADGATPPATIYVALLDGDSVEITGRVAVAWTDPAGTAATQAAADETFTATSDGTATQWATFDAAAAGNMLTVDPLRRPQGMVTGQTITIVADQLTMLGNASGV